MKKIERNIENLKIVLKKMEELGHAINVLDYYETNSYFDSYLEKEEEKIKNVIKVMESMNSDDDLLEDEDDE